MCPAALTSVKAEDVIAWKKRFTQYMEATKSTDVRTNIDNDVRETICARVLVWALAAGRKHNIPDYKYGDDLFRLAGNNTLESAQLALKAIGKAFGESVSGVNVRAPITDQINEISDLHILDITNMDRIMEKVNQIFAIQDNSGLRDHDPNLHAAMDTLIKKMQINNAWPLSKNIASTLKGPASRHEFPNLRPFATEMLKIAQSGVQKLQELQAYTRHIDTNNPNSNQRAGGQGGKSRGTNNQGDGGSGTSGGAAGGASYDRDHNQHQDGRRGGEQATRRDNDTNHYCFGCHKNGGKNHMYRMYCDRCNGHPQQNKENVDFLKSKVYLEAVRVAKEKGLPAPPTELPTDRRLDGTPLTSEELRTMQVEREKAKQSYEKHIKQRNESSIYGPAKPKSNRGESPAATSVSDTIMSLCVIDNCDANLRKYVDSCSNIVPDYLRQFFVLSADNSCFPVDVLLDTGALQANFVSEEVADWLIDKSEELGMEVCVVSKEKANERLPLNLGGTGIEITTLGVIACKLKFLNDLTNKFETTNCLEFKIMNTDFDMIIGRITSRNLHLAKKLPSYFDEDDMEEDPAPDPFYENTCRVCVTKETPCSGCAHSALDPLASAGCHPHDAKGFEVENRITRRLRDAKRKPSPRDKQQLYLNSVSTTNNRTELPGGRMNSRRTLRECTPRTDTRKEILALMASKEELLDYEEDNDFISYDENPFLEPLLHEPEDPKKLLAKIQIFGTEDQQLQLRELCSEFSDLFSEHVRTTPAKVPPMVLDVNESEWFSAKNRLPVRQQTPIKSAEIEKQVTKMLDLGVLIPSNASAYSQAHLVPKPEPNTWRFTVDYTNLNKVTNKPEGHPVPNINEMLDRIGEKKPKFLGVMDFTSGYHQTPIDPKSMIYTSFICFMGLFMWTRLVMGLKGAASYFQRVMATIVLAGLMYSKCELYIDDLLVFAREFSTFLENLRCVFTALRCYNITLNPKKCRFGMPSVEYVGHVIDEHGITFTPEKKGEVLNFPLPQRQQEMLQFLGLVNYFRRHLGQMTELTQPLRDMVDMQNYKKKKRLEWTPELEALFYQVRDKVAACPKLYYPDSNGKIVIETDASDYGIGCYIYQIRDGVQWPIRFMSHKLTGAQLNWSTIEKECFAIYYSIKKFHNILRDRKFLLRTDHRNLVYINVRGSQKVERWKMALQEYDFDIEHLDGVTNIVADGFSRLCAIWTILDETKEKNDYLHLHLNALLEENMLLHTTPEHLEMLKACHNAIVGHGGVERTIDKLEKAKMRWRGRRRDVRRFIRQCPCCQKMSFIRTPIHAHPFTRATYNPMEVLSIDTDGPLPEDIYGNKYILVVIDNFTRWLELYPMKDTTALSAARALIAHFGRFGIPDQIRSDKGSQFVNSLFEELTRILKFDHEIGTGYSKEENSIVERSIGEVMRHLQALIFEKRVQENWSFDYLPLVQRIFNSEINSSTGVSPAEILFGNLVNLNRRIIIDGNNKSEIESPEKEEKPLSSFMSKLIENQELLIRVAAATQQAKDEHHMAMYDGKTPTEFPIGSYVLVTHPKGRRSKLQTFKEGPFQVVNIVGSKYTLCDMVRGKNFDLHISNLHPFLYDPETVDPKEVLNQDQGEFLIESIIEHRGDHNIANSMEFLVHWAGYTEEDDTWEPISNLRDNTVFHQYCIDHKMRKFIPPEHNPKSKHFRPL